MQQTRCETTILREIVISNPLFSQFSWLLLPVVLFLSVISSEKMTKETDLITRLLVVETDSAPASPCPDPRPALVDTDSTSASPCPHLRLYSLPPLLIPSLFSSCFVVACFVFLILPPPSSLLPRLALYSRLDWLCQGERYAAAAPKSQGRGSGGIFSTL